MPDNPPPPTALSWRRARVDYRHVTDQCTRLLFQGYLAPGTRIEIRCPSCGGMHVISVPQPSLNGTAVCNGSAVT